MIGIVYVISALCAVVLLLIAKQKIKEAKEYKVQADKHKALADEERKLWHLVRTETNYNKRLEHYSNALKLSEQREKVFNQLINR